MQTAGGESTGDRQKEKIMTCSEVSDNGFRYDLIVCGMLYKVATFGHVIPVDPIVDKLPAGCKSMVKISSNLALHLTTSW